MKERISQGSSLHNKKLMFTVFVLYFVVVIIFASISYRIVTLDVKRELGNKAMVLAVDIAGWLDIDRAEFDRLASLEFNQLLKDPKNVSFENRARNIMAYSEIKYIYFEAPIGENQVKYQVEDEEQEIYGTEPGTPLNVIYLLDAVIDDETRLLDTDGKGYVDKDRYTVMYPSYKKIYGSRKPTYLINSDEWGTYITGYAPYYDHEGNYLGLLGVDLFLDSYNQYLKKNLIVIGSFVFTLVIIGMYTLYLVFRVWSAEERARIGTLLSNTDSLTGLLNRRRFGEFLEHEWIQSMRDDMPLSMLIIDVDYFKEYNDHYGHLHGDDALRRVAEVLNDNVKRSTDFVGRFGGDEFIAILHNADAESAQRIANNIVEGVQKLNICHNDSIVSPYITVTIGVASLIPSEDMTIEEFIHRADEALYHAKHQGRNQAQLWDESTSKN
ncbi:MAG: GGDEF domain-containing protein [Bacillota bacterium]